MQLRTCFGVCTAVVARDGTAMSLPDSALCDGCGAGHAQLGPSCFDSEVLVLDAPRALECADGRRCFCHPLTSRTGESATFLASSRPGHLASPEIAYLVSSAARLAQAAISVREADAARNETADELDALVGIAGAFGDGVAPARSLPQLALERAMALTGATSGRLWRTGADGVLHEVMSLPGHGGSEYFELASRAGRSRRSLIVTDLRSSNSGRSASTTTAICVPIGRSERTVGAMLLGFPGDRRVGAEQLAIAERYARLAAFAFAIEALDEAAERRWLESTVGSAAERVLGAAGTTEEFASILSSVICKSIDTDIGGVFITRYQDDLAAMMLSQGLDANEAEAVLEVATGGKNASPARILVNYSGASGYRPDPRGWAVTTAHIGREGDVSGCAFAARGGSVRFTDAEERVLRLLASRGGEVLHRAVEAEAWRAENAKVVDALCAALDIGERGELGHVGRVMEHAILIGEEMGLSVADLETLRFAGLFHDVGKLGVPEDVLLKRTRLTDAELHLIRRHSEVGANIVEQLDFLESIAPVILHHHERWDGEGYPEGLAGDQIPLLARILCVSDSFNAMLADTPYRPKLSYVQARVELEKGAGSQFDPAVVQSFLRVLDIRVAAGDFGLLAPDLLEGPQLPS